MSIIGKWKYSEMLANDGGEIGWMPVEEYVKKTPDPMFELMLYEVIEFTEDGKMITSAAADKLPEELKEDMTEEIAAAVDGIVVMQETEWKEEDGKFFMKDENPGTLFDEPAPEWIELPIEDGKISMLAMSLLSRID